MQWFLIGMSAGVLLTIPLAGLFARRWAQRARGLEQRARAAEHLADLGMMTSGLAHEIKNPLSTIGLNVQLIREDLQQLSGDGDPAREDHIQKVDRRFNTLLNETSRVRQILDDFLRFAGRVRLQRVDTDVNELASELIDFFAPQAEEAHVHLRSQLSASPATICADPALLKQAILNLLINACQAMVTARTAGQPSGGNDELIVKTDRGKSLGRDEIRLHVIDTGPGIEPKLVDQIFTPYFSTKQGGTGLGLPTAKRIVEEHGGTIGVHSDAGRGTDICISLPVDPPMPQSAD